MDIEHGTNTETLTQLVQSEVATGRLERDTTTEAYYMLPFAESANYPNLFKKLDANMVTHGIKSYGISTTTLEEIFLKLALEHPIDERPNVQNGDTNEETVITTDSSPNTYNAINVAEFALRPSFSRSFLAFLKVKLKLVIKSPGLFLSLLISPIVLLVAIYFLLGDNVDRTTKSLQLSAKIYGDIGLNVSYWATSPKPNIDAALKQIGLSANYQGTGNITLKTAGDGIIGVKFGVSFTRLPRIRCLLIIISLQMPDNWYVNDTALHATPILQNVLSNIYWQITANGVNFNPIQVSSHPLFQYLDIAEIIGFDIRIIIIVILISTVTGQIPPLLAPEIVEERQTRIKDFLRVSGLHYSIYWLVNLSVHMSLLLFIFFIGLIANVSILHIELFQDANAAWASTLLLLMYYPVAILSSYSLSYMFDKKETARSTMPYITFLVSWLDRFRTIVFSYS